MDGEIRKIRLRVAMIVGGFVALIAIVSVFAYFAGIDRTVPSNLTYLPDEQVSEAPKLSVYGLENISQTTLSSNQVGMINQALSSFVSDQKLEYVTIVDNSVKFSSSGDSRVVGFNIESNKGSLFRVAGGYAFNSDMTVEIFDSNNKSVYNDDYDFHDD